jgi:NAD(P)-dependent dehydrogenase (short-subunit alcohol dehydrogenase family)
MGLATAKLLASHGASISLADINEEGLTIAMDELSSLDNEHMLTQVDMRSSDSVDAWIARTVQNFGKLDGAVNMAGVLTPARPIAEETDDNLALTLDVNVHGIFRCLRAQLGAMSHGGSIVGLTFDHFSLACLTHKNRSQQPALLDRSVFLDTRHIAVAKQP